MLEQLVKKLSEIALPKHLRKIRTTAAFIVLIVEQLGQVAQRYWHSGRESKQLPSDITDIIVQCVCMLNWLGYSEAQIEQALEESMDKLARAIIES